MIQTLIASDKAIQALMMFEKSDIDPNNVRQTIKTLIMSEKSNPNTNKV